MENVFYVKLVTGEDVVSKIQDFQDDAPNVLLEDPMLIQYFSSKTGFDAGMRPWIPGVIKQNKFTVRKGHIMFMLPISEALSRFYDKMVDNNIKANFVETTEDDDFEEQESKFEEMMANTTGPHSTRIH